MRSASSRDRFGDTDDDTAEEDEHLTVLTFDLAGDRYCVEADAVASVRSVTGTAALGAADDPWNAGAVAVDGQRVRVVDLPRVFGSTARTIERADEPMLLVLTETDAEGNYYGWLVDDVDVTKTVRITTLKPTRTATQFVEGRFEFDDGGAIWIDENAMHE
ncbi:chemotaxis protein CheW [Halopiger djelfimassiliensis]|uniref:chemotaxis protein CheW n=1 Tax=Halopiger djelfimassiliensis TaxID=1293047 RepID=UPI000677B74C|nr:chemotaxis protein CheW [Halopiger djelfimassiliensis]